MGTVEFHKSPLVQHGHFIEISDRVQLMRYGDDRVARAFLPDDALDQFVGDVIETLRIFVRQYVFSKEAETVQPDGNVCAGREGVHTCL